MAHRPLPIPATMTMWHVVGKDGTYATFGTTDPDAQITYSWNGTQHRGWVSGSETAGFVVQVPTDPSARAVKAP